MDTLKQPCVHQFGPWIVPEKDETTAEMYKLGLEVVRVSVCSICGKERFIVHKHD